MLGEKASKYAALWPDSSLALGIAIFVGVLAEPQPRQKLSFLGLICCWFMVPSSLTISYCRHLFQHSKWHGWKTVDYARLVNVVHSFCRKMLKKHNHKRSSLVLKHQRRRQKLGAVEQHKNSMKLIRPIPEMWNRCQMPHSHHQSSPYKRNQLVREFLCLTSDGEGQYEFVFILLVCLCFCGSLCHT